MSHTVAIEPRVWAFSNIYDDTPNLQFLMRLEPLEGGVYRCRYFTIPVTCSDHDYIDGVFPSPDSLKKHMFALREGCPKMTARLWLHADDLWHAERKRLEADGG